MGKRRRRSSKSKTGLTPPCKTGSNMASQNQNNNNVSDVITQGHDCLHGSYTEPSTSANVSQPNVNNQTFNYSSNFTHAPPPNLPRPILQSTPLPGSIQGIPQQPGPILFMPPTMTNGPNDVPMPVTPQMILANMNETNQRMQRLEVIINDKLSKLDLLDVLNDKLGKFEQNLSNMQTEIGNIKSVQQKQAQTLQNEEKHHHNIEDRIRELELCNRKLEFENYELNEKILEIQTHSMKYNLIFGGIKSEGAIENTENVVKKFLVDELLIPEAEVSEFKFQNVHRLGERRDGKERSIIARFTRYSDHERVRSIAAGKLKAKPQFTVYQQYPREIYERRRNLIPKMKELKRQKHTVKLVYDKLIVDGHPYNPRNDPHPGN